MIGDYRSTNSPQQTECTCFSRAIYKMKIRKYSCERGRTHIAVLVSQRNPICPKTHRHLKIRGLAAMHPPLKDLYLHFTQPVLDVRSQPKEHSKSRSPQPPRQANPAAYVSIYRRHRLENYASQCRAQEAARESDVLTPS